MTASLFIDAPGLDGAVYTWLSVGWPLVVFVLTFMISLYDTHKENKYFDQAVTQALNRADADRAEESDFVENNPKITAPPTVRRWMIKKFGIICSPTMCVFWAVAVPSIAINRGILDVEYPHFEFLMEDIMYGYDCFYGKLDQTWLGFFMISPVTHLFDLDPAPPIPAAETYGLLVCYKIREQTISNWLEVIGICWGAGYFMEWLSVSLVEWTKVSYAARGRSSEDVDDDTVANDAPLARFTRLQTWVLALLLLFGFILSFFGFLGSLQGILFGSFRNGNGDSQWDTSHLPLSDLLMWFAFGMAMLFTTLKILRFHKAGTLAQMLHKIDVLYEPSDSSRPQTCEAERVAAVRRAIARKCTFEKWEFERKYGDHPRAFLDRPGFGRPDQWTEQLRGTVTALQSRVRSLEAKVKHSFSGDAVPMATGVTKAIGRLTMPQGIYTKIHDHFEGGWDNPEMADVALAAVNVDRAVRTLRADPLGTHAI